ncbi:MAG: HlyD family efflux transporter periplasmic adaptor subunit [Proteobacteria bacterium]|nr:HlyD family efflux transporter periplasmic adaptor subunit [Pseudomonadota bacterium]
MTQGNDEAASVRPEARGEQHFRGLELPDVPFTGLPGTAFAARAVSIVLGIFAVLIAVSSVTVTFITMHVSVEAHGVLEPVRHWLVRAQESGRVTSVLVHAGDTVQRGDVLARLDSLSVVSSLAQIDAQVHDHQLERQRLLAIGPVDSLRRTFQVAQTEISIARALAQLRQRQTEFGVAGSADSLASKHRFGAHIGLDLAVADVRAAVAERGLATTDQQMSATRAFEIARQEANLASLARERKIDHERLRRLEVVAPATGIIMTERPEEVVGAFVHEGDSVLDVADPHEWRASLLVGERDVHRIRLGDDVRVDIPAIRFRQPSSLQGRVIFIAEAPVAADNHQSGSAPGMYRILASVAPFAPAGADYARLRQGYSVEAKIVTRTARGLVLLREWLVGKLDR